MIPAMINPTTASAMKKPCEDKISATTVNPDANPSLTVLNASSLTELSFDVLPFLYL